MCTKFKNIMDFELSQTFNIFISFVFRFRPTESKLVLSTHRRTQIYPVEVRAVEVPADVVRRIKYIKRKWEDERKFIFKCHFFCQDKLYRFVNLDWYFFLFYDASQTFLFYHPLQLKPKTFNFLYTLSVPLRFNLIHTFRKNYYELANFVIVNIQTLKL